MVLTAETLLPTTATLAEKLRTRSATMTVVGIGYVGLPLAMALAEAGFKVYGFDASPRRVAELARGESPILDVSAEQLQTQLKTEHFIPTTDTAVLTDSDVAIICVPTPITRHKHPDTSYVESASRTIAAHLKPGMLVILESTTYPGTTIELVQPILEAGGLKAGTDFHLVFSPERVDPGNAKYTIANTPKVIGGLTPACTALAHSLYASISSPELVIPVNTPTIAEFVKLLENTFRSVNIALVNELAQLAHRMGVNIWEVIDAAATKPYGFMPFYPGPGVGGHCIPVDPYYLHWKAQEYDFQTRFIVLAAETNEGMPSYVLSQVFRVLNRAGKPVKGSKILALGVTFKPDISDNRNSPAMRVLELLADKGAALDYHDPYVPHLTLGESHSDFASMLDAPIALASVPLTPERLRESDLVILLVHHSSFDIAGIVADAPLVFDTRNATKSIQPRPGHVFVL
ncbi:MAG: nucleotide sugar dehydrogenase [bacterium]